MKKKILVHVCCGPCATSSILRLLEEGWEPVLYFSNSNIYPYGEEEKRYENALIVASHYNLRIIKGEYNHEEWREWVKGLEGEKERGKRCNKCFRFNLLKKRILSVFAQHLLFQDSRIQIQFSKKVKIYQVLRR